MRDIKFRAWHSKQNKMFSPEEMGEDQLTIMPDGRGFINVHGLNTKLSSFIPEMIPMQFTGLKDKNGKEIYERDILKDVKGIGVVYFYPPQFVVQTEEEVAYQLAAGFVNKEILEETEIIGNIYESPELLK